MEADLGLQSLVRLKKKSRERQDKLKKLIRKEVAAVISRYAIDAEMASLPSSLRNIGTQPAISA